MIQDRPPASSASEEQNKDPDIKLETQGQGDPSNGHRQTTRPQDSGFSREALRPLCLLRRELDPAVTPRPSAKVVRSLCRRIGVVPGEFRARIWSLLLLEGQEGGQEEEDRLRQELKDVTFDCERQQTLEVDLERTRAEEAFFRDPKTRNQIRRFLTLYCKQQGITYKQGLHELVAPFIALQQHDAGLDEVRLYRCFVAFLDLFLKGIYADDEMRKAQCLYQSVRLLLTYHCPTLALHIEHKASLSPELYLTSYVLTLFSRSLDLDTTTKLWDQLIVEGECVSPLFVLTALFHSREADLLNCSIEDLPSAVTQLRFQGLVQARALLAHARRLQHDTPHSFCRRLQRLCNRDPNVRQYEALLQDLSQAMTLTIHPNEAIRGVTDFLDVLERAMPPTPIMGPSPPRSHTDGEDQPRRRKTSSSADRTATRRRRSSAGQADLEGVHGRSVGFDEDEDAVHTRNEEREADEHACFGADAGNGRGVTAAGGTAAALPAYSSRERRAKDRRGHNFIFCDCRPTEEYEAFHLETAGQLDLFVQGGGGEDKVTAFVAGLKAWHGIAHICIITAEASVSVDGRGSSSSCVGGRVLWALLGMGVGRVSHVQGGMAATLRALETQLYSSAKHRSSAGQAKHRKLQQVLVSSRAMEPARRQNFVTRLFAGSRRSTGASSGLFQPPPHKGRHSDPVNSGGQATQDSRHRSSFSVLRELDDDDEDTAQPLSGSGKPRRRSRGSSKSGSQRVDELPTRSPPRKADQKVTAFLQFYGGKASLSSASEHSSSEHSSSDHTDSDRPPIARPKPPTGKDANPSGGLFWLPRRKSDVPSGSRAAGDSDSHSPSSRAVTGEDTEGPEGRHSTGSLGMHAHHVAKSASSLFSGAAFSGPGSGSSLFSYILPADKDKAVELPEGHRGHGSGVSRTSSLGSTPWWSFNRSSSSSSTQANDGLPAPLPLTADDSLNPPDRALSPPTLAPSGSIFTAFADAFSSAAPSSPTPAPDPTADAEGRPSAGQSRLLAGFLRLVGSNSPQRSSSFGEVGDGSALTHDESHTEEFGDGEALVDVRPYLERGASEGRAYFPARRLLPHSGHLSHCVLVVTNNTILQGVEVSGRPGFIRKVDEQDIAKLVKVTRRKSQAENLRLHFDEAGPIPVADAPVAPLPGSGPPSRRGSLSSRVMEVYCPEIQEVVAVLSGKIEEIRQQQDLRPASLSSVDAVPFSPASPPL